MTAALSAPLWAPWWPGSLALLLLTLVVGVGAGAVRGFAGFGFSALVVAGLSPFVAPGPLVAAVLGLEAVASLSVMRQVADDVDRPWCRALLIGNAVCVPLGLAALAWLPVTPVRLLVGAALLAGAVALRLTDGREFRSTAALRTVAGAASGLLNGLAASGGVAAAMLMATTRPPPAQLRATMITFLLYVSFYALIWSAALTFIGGTAGSALIGMDTLRWGLVLWPAMMLGMRLGQRAFGTAHPGRYRRFVLNLLMVISALGLLNALAKASGAI